MTRKFIGSVGALCALLVSPVMGATNLESLESMYSSGSRLNDTVEQEYLANRCSALHLFISTTYNLEAERRQAENDSRGGDFQSTADNFQKSANYFLQISTAYLQVTGRSQDFMEKRIVVLGKKYAALYSENSVLHNVGVRGMLERDMVYCQQVIKSKFFQR